MAMDFSLGAGPEGMRVTLFLFLLVLLAIVGGAAFLLTWDIPAPTAPVEKVISNDRFPR